MAKEKKIECLTLKEILTLWGNRQGDSINKCHPHTFFGEDSIQFYEAEMEINGCRYKIFKRKDDRIWIIQEPICLKYQPRDFNLYSEKKQDQFGVCYNVSNSNGRETKGCALAKRIQCYFPTNRKKEGEILYSPPITPHNKN